MELHSGTEPRLQFVRRQCAESVVEGRQPQWIAVRVFPPYYSTKKADLFRQFVGHTINSSYKSTQRWIGTESLTTYRLEDQMSGMRFSGGSSHSTVQIPLKCLHGDLHYLDRRKFISLCISEVEKAHTFFWVGTRAYFQHTHALECTSKIPDEFDFI